MNQTYIDPTAVPADAADPTAYIRIAFDAGDVEALIQAEAARLGEPAAMAAALLNLGVLNQLVGRRDEALACQAAALERNRLYRHPAPPADTPPLRLLAIVTGGDLMTNTPIELMLEGRAVELTKLFVAAEDAGLPPVPDHDLAMVAVSESDETRPVLRRLEGLGACWPRPVVNDAGRIAALARDSLHRLLADGPGVLIPPTARASREALAAVVEGRAGLGSILPDACFPIIIRPVGSHAGKGLDKLDAPAALGAYLDEQPAARLYVSPFVDYRSGDGHYRKYRIAVFGGRPYLAHLAVGDHWMVHYLNAGMAEDADKRQMEADAMASFDEEFSRQHAAALATISERLGLDYYALDCAEMQDGRLLVFEADVAMIIHDLDPAELYPYKKPQMRKLFGAFEAFLRTRAQTADITR